MIIYPAIDLIDGQCVRLEKGDFAKKTIYEKDPVVMALKFKHEGSGWLHIIDLDGAKNGAPQQTALILDVQKKTGLKVQTGGGIRSVADAEKILDSGIERVIIGSLAVREPNVISSLINKYGSERIVLALDVKIENDVAYIATDGWTKTSELSLDEALTVFSRMSAKHVLITDISKDGLLQGPNINLYKSIAKIHPHLQVQASGGVSNLGDLKTLNENDNAGVIVGKALYEGIFTYGEANNLYENASC